MAGLAKQQRLCGVAVGAWFAAALMLPALIVGAAFAQTGYQAPASPSGQLAPQSSAPASVSPPPAAAPPVPSQPEPGNRPGFLHQLKVWWDDSVAFFDVKSKDTLGGADETNKNPGEADRSTADAAKGAARSAAAATQDAMKNAVEASKSAATTATDAMKSVMEATKKAASVIVRLPNTRIIEMREVCARAPNGASDCATAAANGCRAKGFAGGNSLDTRSAEKCDSKPSQRGQIPSVHCASEAVVLRAVCQ